VINAILWKLRTGAPWRDLPERYGPWKTAHERLRLWTADGTWQRILDDVIVKDDSVGEIEWILSVDSSVVRAHQHAAGARKKRGCTAGIEDLAVDGEGLGRSRGGSTKIHLAVDGRGLPIRALLTPGQAGDNPQLVTWSSDASTGSNSFVTWPHGMPGAPPTSRPNSPSRRSSSGSDEQQSRNLAATVGVSAHQP
jgi:transposase